MTAAASEASAAVDSLRTSFGVGAQMVGVTDHDLQIAGLHLRLRFAGDPLAQIITRSLAHHPGPTGTEPDLTIHLWDTSVTHAPRPSFPDDAIDGGVTGATRTAATTSVRLRYQPDIRVLSAIDHDDRAAWYCVADIAELPWWERAAPLRTLLAWWLAGHGLVLTHAAAVGSRHAAALLVGRGGSGKSSTALTCLVAGMGYLGDDYCVVDPVNARAATIYGTAKLHADQLGNFGALGSFVMPLDREPDAKVVVLPADFAPAQMIDDAAIAAIIAPTVTGGAETSIESLRGAAALAALAPSTIFQLPGAGGTEFSALAAMARRLPSARLLLGTDRDAIAPTLATYLDELTSRSP